MQQPSRAGKQENRAKDKIGGFSWAVSSVGRTVALQASGRGFESPTVHKYRDSNGGHGRKPTLKGDPVKAFADSEYRKWNGESEYSWSGNETDSWAEVREGFESPTVFKKETRVGNGNGAK